MINSVVLVGRVGQDPEMKYFESGKVKTSFSVAVNRWSNAEKKEIADWFNVELWDKSAEIAGEYVKKGRLVAIEGRLDASQWTDNDGNKRERYFVRGSNLRLLGGKNESPLMN
jgi:single-strand DNA-binding protein